MSTLSPQASGFGCTYQADHSLPVLQLLNAMQYSLQYYMRKLHIAFPLFPHSEYYKFLYSTIIYKWNKETYRYDYVIVIMLKLINSNLLHLSNLATLSKM